MPYMRRYERGGAHADARASRWGQWFFVSGRSTEGNVLASWKRDVWLALGVHDLAVILRGRGRGGAQISVPDDLTGWPTSAPSSAVANDQIGYLTPGEWPGVTAAIPDFSARSSCLPPSPPSLLSSPGMRKPQECHRKRAGGRDRRQEAFCR